jgi:hypothetical protein
MKTLVLTHTPTSYIYIYTYLFFCHNLEIQKSPLKDLCRAPTVAHDFSRFYAKKMENGPNETINRPAWNNINNEFFQLMQHNYSQMYRI